MAKVQHTCTGCVPIDASIIEAYVALVNTNEGAKAAEALRVVAEESRVDAEEDRVEAEAARVDEEAARVSAEDARVVAENARAAAEDLREGAEDDRAAVETARETAEAARVAAEAMRVSAEESRESAEAARAAQASADHTVAAGDHTQAAADHTTAEADHTTAGSDHTRAGEDHTLAAADHVTAEADHATWAGYRVVVKSVGETAPASPSSGDKWYKTTDNKIYSYDGSSWDSGVAATTGATIVNSATNDVYVFNGASLFNNEAELSQLEAKVPYKTDKKGGKNLLDLSVITRNKSFNSSGVISDNANYSISGFIPISASTDYCYSRKNSSSSPGGSQYVCFYDSNKNFVSSLIPSGLTFSSPAGVAYMRVTLYNNYITEANELMVETGTTRGTYKAFNPIGGYPLPEQAAKTLENKVDIKPGKNLIDVNAAIPGLISSSTGDVVSGSNYHISDFIPVTAGQSYRFTREGSTSYPGGSNYTGYYDADKNFISAEIPDSATITIPSGASYVRVTIYNNYLSDDIQFEAGTTRTAYQPYSPVGGYPSGPADISGSLVQTTGTATDKAMSQKATTDAINAAVSGIDVSTAINRMKYAQIVGDENKLFVQKDFSLNPSDYTNTRAIVTSENGKLKITCDTVYSYHIAWLDFTGNPLDLSNSQFGIDLDLVEGNSGATDHYTEIDEIDIMLCSEDTKRTDENSYSTLDAYPVIVNALYILHPGEYKANAPLYLARNGVVHTVDLTSVKWVAIRIKTIKHSEPGRTDYDGTPSIIVNRLFTFAKPRRRQVLFGFDGGYTGQIDAGDYLASKGLFGTFFVTRYHIGDEGHISASQLHTLKKAGHLIGMYSAPSPWKGWYDMTLAEKKTAIVDQAEWLYENGFGDGALYASVPGGGYSEDEDVLFTQGKIKMLTGRSLYSKYDTVCGFYGPYSTGHSCGPSVPTSYRKDAIDALIQDGGFCIFIFHQCTGQTDDITLADFKEIVDYVATKRNAGLLEVVTANDFKTYTLSTAPQSE